MLRNSKAKEAAMWAKLADMLNTPEHKQICASYSSEALYGRKVIPLPNMEETFSAGEVGQMLGITANMVGRLANINGLKTPENGRLVLDKSKSSMKEVETWRYTRQGVDAIRECLELL